GKWRHDSLRERDLRGSNVANADLGFGKLRGANLKRSGCRNANLAGADLRGANLTESKFEGALVPHADLRGSDRPDAAGLALSESNIRNARFSPNADDDWSVLRRTYTGARLLFHVLLMLAFFLPFVAKTFYWVAMNKAQHHAQTLYSDVAKAVSTH